MRIIQLTQGTPEWHRHRATHFNASDAPAMMGQSPYTPRGELLKRIATGITPEVDQNLQRIFDKGHELEAKARPVVEKMIGRELYPLVGAVEDLSASFDGITIDELLAWEHKTLNNSIRQAFEQAQAAGEPDKAAEYLPAVYRIQMEHQLIVSGAEKVLFTASNDLEMMSAEYVSDPALREKIKSGWAQFKVDLSNWTPEPEAAPAPTGQSPELLPALRIKVSGDVIASNLEDFRSVALAAIRGVNRDLKTDKDFADADASIKWCADVESRLAYAKKAVLEDAADVQVIFETLDAISAESRAVRLELEKLTKSRKESIKAEIINECLVETVQHLKDLGISVPVERADFSFAVKGKRSIVTMRSAAQDELARWKAEATMMADLAKANQALIDQSSRPDLFADHMTLRNQPTDSVKAVIQSRILASAAIAEAEALKAKEADKNIKAVSQAALQLSSAVDDSPTGKAPPNIEEANLALGIVRVNPAWYVQQKFRTIKDVRCAIIMAIEEQL